MGAKQNVFLSLSECQPKPDLTVWWGILALIHFLRQAYLGSVQTASLFMATWPGYQQYKYMDIPIHTWIGIEMETESFYTTKIIIILIGLVIRIIKVL